MSVLIQKKIFQKKIFETQSDGISVEMSNWTNKTKYFVKYENLDFDDLIYRRKISWNLIALSFITLFYTLLYTFSLINSVKVTRSEILFLIPLLIVTVLILVWTLNEIKNEVIIPTRKGYDIILFHNNPNKKEFKDFLEKIKAKSTN